jgi:outer membrane protein OmpA-like peptidoglycan-associated protein
MTMQRKLALTLLLISSSHLFAQGIVNPEAHKAYVFSSMGKPVLSGNGNCVRFSGYLSTGKPSCYVQPAATNTSASALPEQPADTEPTKEPVVEPAVEPVVEPAPAAEVATAAAASANFVAATSTSATQPSEEPVAAITTTQEPEPVVEDTQVAVAKAVTYSYTTSIIDSHIYFDFDKNNLRIDEQVKLERAIIAAREAHKLFKVSVEGHADSRGTDAYNYDLSQRRINTIVNYLNLRGVETNSTMAWGESQLILNTDGSENFDHSRRAEVIFKIQKKIAN